MSPQFVARYCNLSLDGIIITTLYCRVATCLSQAHAHQIHDSRVNSKSRLRKKGIFLHLRLKELLHSLKHVVTASLLSSSHLPSPPRVINKPQSATARLFGHSSPSHGPGRKNTTTTTRSQLATTRKTRPAVQSQKTLVPRANPQRKSHAVRLLQSPFPRFRPTGSEYTTMAGAALTSPLAGGARTTGQ